METKHKISIIMAMQTEAQPLIDHFGLELQPKLDAKLPMQLYQKHIGEVDLSVLLCGRSAAYQVENVGTQPATLAAYLAAQHLQPDVLVNAGTCGAFGGKGSKIGEVYVCDTFVYHDRRISIPGYVEYGLGRYQVMDASTAASVLDCEMAMVTTGNSLDICPTDMESMQKMEYPSGRLAKEMEAAAIAWVMEMMEIPFFAIKSVTDLVDGDRLPQDEFLENIHMASDRLRDKLIELIDLVSEHGLSAILPHETGRSI